MLPWPAARRGNQWPRKWLFFPNCAEGLPCEMSSCLHPEIARARPLARTTVTALVKQGMSVRLTQRSMITALPFPRYQVARVDGGAHFAGGRNEQQVNRFLHDLPGESG